MSRIYSKHPKFRFFLFTQSFIKPKALEPEMDNKAKGSAGLTLSRVSGGRWDVEKEEQRRGENN